jgi:hypothetical protein
VKTKIPHYFLAALALYIGACNPIEEGDTIPISTEICIEARHHDVPHPELNIFLKYNVDTFPGYYNDASWYDTMLVTDAAGRACVGPVPPGKHWIIGLGFDEHAQQLLPVFGRLPVVVDLEKKPKIDTILYLYE